MELLRGVSAANNFVLALVPLLSSQLFNSRSRPGGASATPPGRRKPITRIVAEQRDELAPFDCPMPPVLPTERIADRDHAAENFFQGGSPKTGHPTSSPGPPHRQKSFLTKFPGMAPG